MKKKLQETKLEYLKEKINIQVQIILKVTQILQKQKLKIQIIMNQRKLKLKIK